MPKRKPKKKTLENKCDALWREIIKRNGTCDWCGKSSGKLDAHHVMGRGRKSLRWDLRNGVALCFRCHRLKAHSPSAKDVQEYLNWVEEYKADDWEYLMYKANVEFPETVGIIKLQEYLSILEDKS